MSITTGTVAFANLEEHEIYNGESTGKYSLTLTVDESEADALAQAGVKLREYEGNKQRKFSTKYPVSIIDKDDEPFRGPLGRGSVVKVLWKAGQPHPVHGTSTYMMKVRVLEEADDLGANEEGF